MILISYPRITTRRRGFVHARFKCYLRFVNICQCCWQKKRYTVLRNNGGMMEVCSFVYECIDILGMSTRNIWPWINIFCFNAGAGGVKGKQSYSKNEPKYCASGASFWLVTVSQLLNLSQSIRCEVNSNRGSIESLQSFTMYAAIWIWGGGGGL